MQPSRATPFSAFKAAIPIRWPIWMQPSACSPHSFTPSPRPWPRAARLQSRRNLRRRRRAGEWTGPRRVC
eukprot:scaffold32381_cov107-Isochrysis_galbana.AAC.1